MMYEGKHIHYSPVDNKPLCSYSTKLCKQRRLNGYAFCIRHILEDRSAPFKQCAHVAKYNNQKCTNPIPTNENREYCNSHMQVAGMAPKKERKAKKDKDPHASSPEGKVKFADRLKALLKSGNDVTFSDDQIMVDDPYAFSESASETSIEKSSPSGSLSGSPKSSQELNLRMVVEQQSKMAPGQPLENNSNKSTKSNARSPKTINRLHAKIAQNKILDKQKKTQDSVTSNNSFFPKADSSHSNYKDLVLISENLSHRKAGKISCSGSADTNLSQLRIKTGSNCTASFGGSNCTNLYEPCHRNELRTVCVPAKKVWKLKTDKIKQESVQPLQRIQSLWNEHRLYTADLYPLGVEMSDSESEENEMESLQRHWFYTWDKGDTFQVNSEFLPNSRPARLSVRQTEMRRRYNQLCSAHAVSSEQHVYQRKFMSALIRSTKNYPNRTADVIQNENHKITQLIKQRKFSGVMKRNCCYKNESESCSSKALPHTRHCIKHIMYNVDQLLFEHCTAKFADNTQCCVPVFDICHELPLCIEHARKRDNYNKMSAEPKPKKPRKKTKPSALTRPPKRGKKKKRQNNLRPTKQSTQVSALNADTASTVDVPSTLSLGLDSSPGPTVLNADDISKGLEDNLDDDLEDHLSPGSIEKSLELPLDTAELANQASRLLEEHDFTEVLNKIPDDAFNDLFAESKNGDFLPTKEETEELERALAAVDKDVKSLEKLSADSNDITDLANSMDLHSSLINNEHGLDESTLGDLNPSMENLNVITSSLSTNDLNSISQVLSTITTDSLVTSPMPAGLVDGAVVQSQIPGVHMLPELVQGQVQLQVPVNATQATNFVLSPQLLGATFATTTNAVTQGSFNNGPATAISALPATAFPHTVAHTIPLTSQDGISISLQSQLQGIRASQWILSPADQTFAPMVYQNGFPLASQPFAGHVSTLGNLKFPFSTTAVDLLKQNEDGEMSGHEGANSTFITVNGGGLSSSGASSFPVNNSDSSKESVS